MRPRDRRVRSRSGTNERWTHIFNQKYGPPADLRAEVFNGEFSTIRHAGILERAVIREGFVIAFDGQLLARSIELELAIEP